jgi:hypothetical protein
MHSQFHSDNSADNNISIAINMKIIICVTVLVSFLLSVFECKHFKCEIVTPVVNYDFVNSYVENMMKLKKLIADGDPTAVEQVRQMKQATFESSKIGFNGVVGDEAFQKYCDSLTDDLLVIFALLKPEDVYNKEEQNNIAVALEKIEKSFLSFEDGMKSGIAGPLLSKLLQLFAIFENDPVNAEFFRLRNLILQDLKKFKENATGLQDWLESPNTVTYFAQLQQEGGAAAQRFSSFLNLFNPINLFKI